MEVRRLVSAIDERAKIDGGVYLSRDRLIIKISDALRSAGSAIVLLDKPLRNTVAVLINQIDDFNHKIETVDPGQRDLARLTQPLKFDLAAASRMGGEVAGALREILDKEP